MSEILLRLYDNLFEIIIFGDESLLDDPVKSCPILDAMIEFTLSKTEEYEKSHKTCVLNDLEMQRTLMHRRKVHDLLENSGTDIPRHVCVNMYGHVSHAWEIF